ncbi:hypothetical protein JCM10212_000210 [Sporobolomyces blumeae]
MPDLPGSSSGDVSQELIRINNFCMKRGESDIHFWSRALMLSVPPAGPVATFVVENLKHVLDRAERGEFVMKHIGPRLGAMRDQRTPEQRLHDSINPEFSLERIKRHNGVDPAVRPPPLEREPWVPDTAVFTTSFVFLSSAEREPCGALRKAVETLFDKISERYKHFHPADRHHGRLPEEMWTKAMKAGLEKQVARAEQVEYEDSSSDASYELLLVWRDQLIIMAERLRNHQKLVRPPLELLSSPSSTGTHELGLTRLA